jgi:hypothetical protein
VVAAADVAIQQVQVVDKQGQIRSIVVWRCGPDILYADSLDALMDSTRRKKAPEWLVQQITELPADRQFSADGTSKGSVPAGSAHSHVPTDNDAPDFVQG